MGVPNSSANAVGMLAGESSRAATTSARAAIVAGARLLLTHWDYRRAHTGVNRPSPSGDPGPVRPRPSGPPSFRP